MFKIGDYVVHYKEGVCEVIDIGKLDISCSDKGKEYYTLKPVYDAGGILYIPVNSETKQVRGIISAREAEDLIRGVPKISTISVSDEKKRETYYREALLTNECQSWVALIKTSYQRKKKRLDSGKKAINVDDKYLNMAENFLYGELAVVLNIPKSKVEQYIMKEIKEEMN